MATIEFLSLDKLSHFLLKMKEIIPVKTSDLTNDSNFVSDVSYVHTDNNYTNNDATKLSYIEDNANNYTLPMASTIVLGGIKVGTGLKAIDGVLSLDSEEVPVEWADIQSKPTTVGGFGITDAYTKAEVDTPMSARPTTEQVQTLINTAIGSISSISYEVVSALPATGEPAIIYLVTHDGMVSNIYDEYIWVNNAFEKIGSTDIDLSNYWNKTDLVEITNAEIDALFSE